jgi:hypothetical protein
LDFKIDDDAHFACRLCLQSRTGKPERQKAAINLSQYAVSGDAHSGSEEGN